MILYFFWTSSSCYDL